MNEIKYNISNTIWKHPHFVYTTQFIRSMLFVLPLSHIFVNVNAYSTHIPCALIKTQKYKHKSDDRDFLFLFQPLYLLRDECYFSAASVIFYETHSKPLLLLYTKFIFYHAFLICHMRYLYMLYNSPVVVVAFFLSFFF